ELAGHVALPDSLKSRLENLFSDFRTNTKRTRHSLVVTEITIRGVGGHAAIHDTSYEAPKGTRASQNWRLIRTRRWIKRGDEGARIMATPSHAGTPAQPRQSQHTLSPEESRKVHAYWRAANFVSVGQIYLYANPLLREPLSLKHIKPRLLGHWGTTPGLNFIYVHLNRLIKEHDLDMIFIAGPGHRGPALVANPYLEGTYSEIYRQIPQTETGLQRLFKQFSFPGGIPSHAAPETPGSINEGGELGYCLAHAYGAALDNPDLFAACVIGDGEAETGPLAASWHSNKFLNPARDGAVLPILHLNGYKIANPTVLGRMSDDKLAQLFMGYGVWQASRAPEDSRRLDEELQTGRTLRQRWQADRRTCRTCAQGRPAH